MKGRTTIRFSSLSWVICAGLLAQSPPPPSPKFPSKQQVLAFVIQTLDWYHRLPNQDHIAADPSDALFAADNRAISTQVVRFSFDFAKAAMAIAPAASPDTNSEQNSTASAPDFQHLVQMETKTESDAQQASNDLKSLQYRRLKARGKDRAKLDAEIADTQSRLDLLKAISGSFRNLLDFMRTTDASGNQVTDVEAFIDGLERTVPEVSSNAPPAPVVSQRNAPSSRSGILGRISDVTTLARKRLTVENTIGLTDKFLQASQNLQAPLARPLDDAFRSSDLFSGGFKASDVGALRQQEAHLKGLMAETSKVAPAITALAKQKVLLTLYKTHLITWRTSLASRYVAAWKSLIVRLVVVGAVIAFLIGGARVLRTFTSRHLHDSNSRRAFLAAQRVLLWVAIILTLSFAFAVNLSSAATYLGLASAGLVVALQNVILAMLGYFLLIGKLRIRVGDRVQISGVTGDVVEIGWMQFKLREFDSAGESPTGRVVSFSNSFVFLSPATGLFKRIDAPSRNPSRAHHERVG
jgi:hypothetical protein